jgi:hypothetical protein
MIDEALASNTALRSWTGGKKTAQRLRDYRVALASVDEQR